MNQVQDFTATAEVIFQGPSGNTYSQTKDYCLRSESSHEAELAVRSDLHHLADRLNFKVIGLPVVTVSQ